MIYNPFSLEGKTILVTGASSGIGKSIAEECSKMGATLIITGRNEVRLKETFENLEGKDHIMIVADLSNDSGIQTLINNLPKLNGIVLAAAVVEMLPFLFATKEKFDKIYNTNLFSPIEISRLIIKKKLALKNFSLVAINSIAGSTDFCPANGIYGSGKAALKSFLKYMALELAPKKFRVNTISPGMIWTPMHQDGTIDEEKLQETVNKIPFKEWGKPQDVAFATIYLLSDVSSYVTGTDICIDGGYII